MLVLASRYNSHLSLPQLVRVDENPFVPKLQWLQAPFSLLGHRKTLLYIIPLGITKVFTATAAAKSLQSCPTLCNPIDGSPPGSPVPGILQARTLEWVAISFSSTWKRKVKVQSLSRVWLLATSWTAAHQAPLSVGFSRQEYWSGVPLPSPKVFTGIHKIVPLVPATANSQITAQA